VDSLNSTVCGSILLLARRAGQCYVLPTRRADATTTSNVVQMSALKDNGSLQSLYARHNRLGTFTGHALAETLTRNHTLKNVSLSWNAMGPTAGKAIAAGLASNKALQVSHANC
jgi:Ran GTPase-activating protein (RanGAP) involved in mRNA processing and transport